MTVDVSSDDFGAVLNCAVRYACGRRTYMPGIVVGVIVPMIPELNNRTLLCFDRDLEDVPDWGDPCDVQYWQWLRDAVRRELDRREEANLDGKR